MLYVQCLKPFPDNDLDGFSSQFLFCYQFFVVPHSPVFPEKACFNERFLGLDIGEIGGGEQ